MEKIVIHVGFPKTGTTTLQSVLQKVPACGYLGKGLRDNMQPSLSLDLAGAIFFADERGFRQLAPALSDRIHTAAEGVDCLVLSDEAFTFAEHMEIGRHWSRQVISDHDQVAERLKTLCGAANILISVREQRSFLRSFFAQKVKRGLQGETIDAFIQAEIDGLPYRSMLNLLCYDDCVDAYATRFGNAQVHVSVFEAYQADFASHIETVAEVCNLPASTLRAAWGGAHHNKAKTRKAGKRFNGLRNAVPAPLRRLLPGALRTKLRDSMSEDLTPATLSKTLQSDLAAFFAPSNVALAQRTGLDLARWNYPMS